MRYEKHQEARNTRVQVFLNLTHAFLNSVTLHCELEKEGFLETIMQTGGNV